MDLSPSGEFTLKDAYHIANANDLKSMTRAYREECIWKIPALPKIKFFLWQCSHESISVRVLLANRGMNIFPLCPACNSAPETIIHALRNCPKAQSFWNSFSPPCSAASFYDTQLMVLWLHRNNLVFGKSATQKDLKAETLVKAAKMAI
ncbi:putative ribonuclease h protein [Quercus suber]|uniref:Ribonuclease h protein n=1 Tax=Quercus suber TaxID=58331 RepID=A0AAW0KY34_QUESU